MKLKIKSKVELDDYLKFNFHFQRKTLILWIVFSLFVFSIVIYFGGGILPGKLLWCIFLFALYIFLFLISMRKKFKKVYDSDKLMQLECEFIFDEDRFIEKTSRGQEIIYYSDVMKVQEDKNAIYIFIGELRSYIIPKRYISEENQKKLIEMIYLGKNNIKD